MSQLVDLLLNETTSLKEQYLAKISRWATDEYHRIVNRVLWKEADWCHYLNIEPVLVNKGTTSEFLSFPREFYRSGKPYSKWCRLRNEANRVSKMTESQFVETQVKAAETHYFNSITKLASRIESKELDIQNLKMETSHLGANIDTIITDGIKTVRAFTIIASGAVQKPHYRYLIK